MRLSEALRVRKEREPLVSVKKQPREIALDNLKRLVQTRQRLGEWKPYQTWIYGPRGKGEME